MNLVERQSNSETRREKIAERYKGIDGIVVDLKRERKKRRVIEYTMKWTSIQTTIFDIVIYMAKW